jgi:hypothetical protein
MTPRTYASPEAFKQALEQRLRASAKSGADFGRKRQLLVFDRFLARVIDVFGEPMVNLLLEGTSASPRRRDAAWGSDPRRVARAPHCPR